MHTVHTLWFCVVVYVSWLVDYIHIRILKRHTALGQPYIAPTPLKQLLKNMGKLFIWIHKEWWYNLKKQDATIYCTDVDDDEI